jgi:hypothetical protein
MFDGVVWVKVRGSMKSARREAGGDEDIMGYRVMVRMKVKMRIWWMNSGGVNTKAYPGE